MGEVHIRETRNITDQNSMTFEERQRQIEEEKEREREEYERQKKSPYRRWLQVNKDAYKAEDWLMAKSPIAYRIFKFLINNMDSYNAVMCSYQVMQEQFGVSKPTIQRAIKLLKEKKYLKVYKSGTANIYTINKEIVWSSWGNNYKHGKFGAAIILSESEQEEVVTKIQTQLHKEISIKE